MDTKASTTTHLWLKTGAVTLTLEQIATLTDEQARLFMAELRWHKDQQVCPECGAIDHCHNIRTRGQWRCKHCFRAFSVATGTPFRDHKIGYRKLLVAIFAFVIQKRKGRKKKRAAPKTEVPEKYKRALIRR